ncbi:MAG: signal peptidase II [Pseudomonadota bacterium]|jgi:signal peptidase II
MKLACVAGPVIILDQITKAVVLKTLPLYRSVPVIPGLFNLTHIHNPGGAFGFLSGQSPVFRSTVFLLITTMAIGVILYLYKNTPRTHPWLATGFALVFGGAVGNLIDRFQFGKVVDFLDVYLGNFHWPAFNVADSAITVGIGIFVVHLLFRKMPE